MRIIFKFHVNSIKKQLVFELEREEMTAVLNTEKLEDFKLPDFNSQ